MEEKFQYNALNLMDERCTVEVTVNYETMCVHLFDLDGAVYPMYDFVNKTRILNDEFIKMIEVLSTKRLLREAYRGNEVFKLEQFDWFFYVKDKPILKYIGKTKEIVKLNEVDMREVDCSFFSRMQ